jgi:hypothetical protein
MSKNSEGEGFGSDNGARAIRFETPAKRDERVKTIFTDSGK